MAEATITLHRGDEPLELNIHYSIGRDDPSVGVFGAQVEPDFAEIYSKEGRGWIVIELSELEWDTVVELIQEGFD